MFQIRSLTILVRFILLLDSTLLPSSMLLAKTEKAKSPESVKATAAITSEMNYRHEVMVNAKSQQDQGSLKYHSNEEAATLKTEVTTLKLGYGYLVDDNTEPFLEFVSTKDFQKINDYSVDKQSTTIGLGVLFNLPIVNSLKLRDVNYNLDSPLFSAATVVPYGGLILTSANTANEGGILTKLKSSNGDVITKLILGVRLIPYFHMSTHLQMRVSYQKNSNSVLSDEKLGGESTRMTTEFDLFAFSILI